MSSEQSEVAILGMAVRLPEADTLDAFLHNLRTGRDSVREISEDRKRRTSLPLEEAYQLCGYLDDIDTFDPAFFNLSKGEAKAMSPHHRLLLMVAYQAIENAGHDPASLRGSRTSVYLGDTRIFYDELARTPEPTLVMGSHVSAMAGRLARFFGLRGPAAMIDTACSSSLVALHLAMNDLLLGESDLALVGCASLNLFADRLTGELDIGIRSTDGKTRCFSADAAGTGSGEAVVALLLKRHDRALQDGDPIHAVIRSVAVNQVGGRASTLTAPDAESEAEVIRSAWEKAGIDPETVTYIEAHGTATRLGDPIEIEGIDMAFSRVTPRKHFCALSSVKSNLGHTWSAAGLVGVVKATLALRNHELYPNLHCATLSPLIDFANSAVTVTRELTPWQPDCGVRRAGVSSYGVMGTNAHAVLEEAVPPAVPLRESACRYWFPLSARSAESLAANLEALRGWLRAHPELHPADVQRTLVAGRGHFEHRFSVAASDLAGLNRALAQPAPHQGLARTAGPDFAVALVCSGECRATPDLARELRRAHPTFDRLYGDCERAAAGNGHPQVARFAFQYAFHGWLQEIGVRFGHLVGEGAGKPVIAALRGRVPLAEAIRLSCEAEPDAVPLRTRVEKLLAGLGGQRVLFVEAGPLSTVTELLREPGLGESHEVVALDGCEGAAAQLLSDLYRAGASWTFAASAGNGRRVELPGYQFQKIRCWLDDVKTVDRGTEEVREAPAALLDTRTEVTRIWQEVLGLDRVNPKETFFQLSGDSISGLEAVNHINDRLGVKLDISAVYDDTTLTGLIEAVEALRAALVKPAALPQTGPELFPATPAQVQVWLGSQFEGGSIAFNLTRSFRLAGHLDPARLQRAVDALAARHEALRTTFHMEGDALMQRLTPVPDFDAAVEVDHHAGPATDEEVRTFVRRFAARPFDLEHGPLLRVQLLELGPDAQALTLCTHHIVADGWSLSLLVRDLGAFLTEENPDLPALTAGDRDFALAGDGHKAAEYWLEQFADVPPQLDLPFRSDKGAAAFQGAYLERRLPPALGSRLKRFSQENGGTPFTALLTLFAAFLSRYTEDGRMVLGTTLAERGGKEAEQQVGMLVRTVPLRIDAAPDVTLGGLYSRVRTAFGDALRHRSHPYEELVQELQRRGRLQTPHLFNVLIEYEQFGEVGKESEGFLAGSGVTATPLDVSLETSVFPLNVMLSEMPDGFYGVLRFDTGLLEPAEIDRMWRGFVELAEVLLAEPAKPLGSLPLLTGAEARRVRTLGYRALDFDASRLVHHEIERHAAERPDDVCLSSPDGSSTFAELNRRANQLARLFRDQHGVVPGDIVALVMDRSRLMVESILALWKSGAAYMPVDPQYPAAFIASVLGSAGVRAAMYDPRQLEESKAASLRDERREIVPLTDRSAADADEGDLGLAVAPDDLAYVIYTSGSTGVPKGAMVEHLGMLNHLHAKVTDLALSGRSIVAHNAPNSFDISVWQMFAAPFAGGRTVIYPQAVQLDPCRFTADLETDAVSVLEVVPSYLGTMLDTWEQAGIEPALSALEYLLVTGEEVHPRLVNRWLERYPAVPVMNAYGPTEASDDITHHLITGPVTSGSVPVGRPIPNTYIYLLDASRRIVPEGEIGDIYASGICVGRGYLHDPGQTARVFIGDPFEPGRRMYRTGDRGRWSAEGTLEFLGRKDHQVKVRGFRLDVGELERRLGECPGVKAGVVATAPDARDQLVAYVVLEPGGSLDRCRFYLAERLPHYMVPASFVALAKLPMTPTGKVDRKALAGAARAAASAVSETATLDEVLETLTGIWAEVLNRRDFGPDARFFELGGNSLRAIQVISRIRNRLKVDLPLEALFLQPSLPGLALEVRSRRPAEVEAIPAVAGPGPYPVAPTQELLLQIERDYTERAAFNRNDLYRLSGDLDPDLLARAFADLIADHESLRTTFGWESGAAVQIVHPPGALPLPFRRHDLIGSPDPAAAARQLVEHRIRTPFAIRSEPLVRADLLKTGPDAWLLLVSLHQLVSDGRSAQVLQEGWLARYEGLVRGLPPALPRPAVQARDVAAWRRQSLTPERKSRHRAFWASRLAGASPSLALSTDRERPPVATLNGTRLRMPLPAALAARIASFARELAVTEFVVAQVAVSLLLLEQAGGTDVTIGTYARGRERQELEDQVGFHVNTLPLRLRLEEDEEVRDLLIRAQQELLEAFEHQAYPYGWTLEELGWRRGVDRSPLFDVMIAYDDLDDGSGEEQAQEPRVRFESLELPRRSKEADLLIVFGRTREYLELAVTYNTDVFSPQLAQRYADRLVEILAAVVDDRPLGEILTPAGDRVLSLRGGVE